MANSLITSTVTMDSLYGSMARDAMLRNIGLYNDHAEINSSDGKNFVRVELTHEQRLRHLGLTPERRGIRMEAKLARRRAAIAKRRVREWSFVLGSLFALPLVVAALAYCWKLGIYAVMG